MIAIISAFFILAQACYWLWHHDRTAEMDDAVWHACVLDSWRGDR